MKKIFALLSLLSIVCVGQANADFICWDGTFGFNAAGFFEKDNRFELSFQGVNVGRLEFEFLHEGITVLGDSYRAKIHVPFKKDECAMNPQTRVWACETLARSIDRNVFVEYGVDDLDRSIPVISATQVDRITALIGRGGEALITFYDKMNSEQPRVQRVSLNIPTCERLGWGSMDGTRFPLRLVQYLEKH